MRWIKREVPAQMGLYGPVRNVTLLDVLISPWMIVVLPAVGFGPLLLADMFLPATGETGGLALAWGIVVTIPCLLATAACCLFQLVRLVRNLTDRDS